MNPNYQKGWTNLRFPLSPIYRVKEGGGYRPARPGKLGCFHQKALPFVGTPLKVQVGLVAICTPLFTKYTPFCFLFWFFFCNVMKFYWLRNDTYFFSIMSRNLTNCAIIPFLTSGMLRNFTDCATMLPFDFWHVAELHRLLVPVLRVLEWGWKWCCNELVGLLLFSAI